MDSSRTHKKLPSLHSLRWVLFIPVLLFVTSACSHIPLPGFPQASRVSAPSDQSVTVESTPKTYSETGRATWYAKRFNGHRTASGEIYHMNKLTAAHKTLPFDTQLLVKNIDTGKKVVVRVNDRGPFRGNGLIDLSFAAAKSIGLIGRGSGRVEITVIPEDGVSMPNRTQVPDNDDGASPFSLQVGAFKTKEKAEKLVADLEDEYDSISMIFERDYFKVRIGAFKDPVDADKIRDSLEKKGLQVFTVKQTPMLARNDSPTDVQGSHD